MLSGLFTRGYNRPAPLPKVQLDETQLGAVCLDNPRVLVIAGAGSGKTAVITERIKYLLDMGVQPQNIVAITFTNLAAEEMRERLRDTRGIGDAFIGTIHSFANRIMKFSGEVYKLYTDELDIQYHRELIQKYCKFLAFDRYLEYKDIQSQVEMGKVSEQTLNELLLPSESAELTLLHRTQRQIEADENTDYPESIETLCKRDNVITFNELLIKAKEYFHSIGASVEHLLVDEFQDVGSLEYQFIQGLNAQNSFFVGDDYQSIYGFKGGNVSLFLQLASDPDWEVYHLCNNYRNGSKILELADTVISQVTSKINKETVIKSDIEGSVDIYSKGKIETVLKQIDGDYRDWFILTRTNKEIFEIADLCEELGIPYVTFKREGLTLAELRGNINSHKVKILTVHTSKGLESKNVILYGNFPVRCPTYMINEEERKVMYVGVTRAKENLLLLN